jgi:hypothetical protein
MDKDEVSIPAEKDLKASERLSLSGLSRFLQGRQNPLDATPDPNITHFNVPRYLLDHFDGTFRSSTLQESIPLFTAFSPHNVSCAKPKIRDNFFSSLSDLDISVMPLEPLNSFEIDSICPIGRRNRFKDGQQRRKDTERFRGNARMFLSDRGCQLWGKSRDGRGESRRSVRSKEEREER